MQERLFLLDQVFDQITFVEAIMSTEAIPCFQQGCLTLLKGDLLSKRFIRERIGHMGSGGISVGLVRSFGILYLQSWMVEQERYEGVLLISDGVFNGCLDEIASRLPFGRSLVGVWS